MKKVIHMIPSIFNSGRSRQRPGCLHSNQPPPESHHRTGVCVLRQLGFGLGDQRFAAVLDGVLGVEEFKPLSNPGDVRGAWGRVG